LSRIARAIQSVRQSSQVQAIADYAKLSLSNDRPIILSLKKFILSYGASTLHKDALRIIGGVDRVEHLAATGVSAV
jgi:hypothetical protein